MNVLLVIAKEINTPVKENACISDCFKSNGKRYAAEESNQNQEPKADEK